MSKEWVKIDRPAKIWVYFVKNKLDSNDVKCTLCPKTFKSPSTDTANYHITKVHGMKIESDSAHGGLKD